MEYIKVDLEHNLSSLRIPQVKLDPQQTVLALKENIERRYGSQPNYVRLTLKSKKGDIVTQMEEDLRTLKFYGVQTGMIIMVMDLNPNSIHKQIENVSEIQKYTMSEQTYNSLPQNFRKWKGHFLQEHPEAKSIQGKIQICDPDYLQSMASELSIGMRCQLEDGSRGEIRFIGKVPQLGLGFYVGVYLDNESSNVTGSILAGNYYFFSEQGRGTMIRPNKLEIGEFPKIEQSDEI